MEDLKDKPYNDSNTYHKANQPNAASLDSYYEIKLRRHCWSLITKLKVIFFFVFITSMQ